MGEGGERTENKDGFIALSVRGTRIMRLVIIGYGDRFPSPPSTWDVYQPSMWVIFVRLHVLGINLPKGDFIGYLPKGRWWGLKHAVISFEAAHRWDVDPNYFLIALPGGLEAHIG